MTTPTPLHTEERMKTIAAQIERFSGGGGGGNIGDMENRVKRLEDDMTDIKVSLARIDAKLDSKIDYKWLTLYVMAIIAVILREELLGVFN